MFVSLQVAIGFPASAITPWTLLINTNNVINVSNYGAVGNNTNDNTIAIQNAINAAAAGGTTNGLSGGTVKFPAGIYLSGPVTMQSGVNLQLETNAILRMLPFGAYPGAPYINSGSAPDFISGYNLHDLEISGAGAIDGQGQPWWDAYGANKSLDRPKMIYFSACNRILITSVTLSNSPMFHMASDNAWNVIVNGVTVQSPPSSGANPSHNTDACDWGGTNIVVQNCSISVGDDDYACGSGTHDVLLTNNFYGEGHGLSIGSYTSGGVSNFTIVNCTFNGTDTGIRIKSDIDRGGLVQNMTYLNITMTNVDEPIAIYAYYTNKTQNANHPSQATPQNAASLPVWPVTSLTPIYRNIYFSNLNVTASSGLGYSAGVVWGRTELPATNIVFNKVNITADNGFALYNVSGAQFVDCNIKSRNGDSTISLFNAQAIITNSAPTNLLFTFDGITTNGYGNSLILYKASGALSATNALDDGPLTLSASTFTVSNSLTFFPSTVVNYILGTNTTTLTVLGNLQLGGTNNIAAGPGFTNGSYTLMTYTGNLTGTLPTLGSVPAGYICLLNTNMANKINLSVVKSADAAVAGMYFLQQPTGTNLGAVLAPPITIVATNASGLPVTNATITLSLASGTGLLNGTLNQNTGPGGVAVFADLSLTSAGIKQLLAVGGTNATAISTNFTIAGLPATNNVPVAVILSNNPVAYWRLNELAGPMAYDLTGNFNGTGEGGIVFGVAGVTNPQFTGFETTNLAARFNGTDSDVAIPALNLNTNAVTIIGWLNLAGMQAHASGLVFCRSGGTVSGLAISAASTTNQLGYNWNNNSSAYNWNSGIILPTNQWSFVALAVSPSNAVVYMATNVTLISATNAVTNAVQPFAGTTYLGYDSNQSARRLNGLLDEVAIFNQTLTANQIGQILSASLVGGQLLAPTSLTASATNLQVMLGWNAAVGATSYNLKRGTVNGGPYPSAFSGLIATNYTDVNVANRTTYYYVVTAVGAGGESVNSLQASAMPLPSNQPTNLVAQFYGNQLQLSWPQDHIGWRLEMQTNDLNHGLSKNWATVPNSTNVMSTNILINPAYGAVFLRLVYP